MSAWASSLKARVHGDLMRRASERSGRALEVGACIREAESCAWDMGTLPSQSGGWFWQGSIETWRDWA